MGPEAAGQGLGMVQAEQAGEVVGGEPGLVVDHHAAQWAVVAGEEGGGVCVMHGVSPFAGLARHPASLNEGWRIARD
ncbi:hypothetical protein D3C81_1929290 [compost metagenome]